MPTGKPKRVGVQPMKEYPTEWTCYPADQEDDDEQVQRDEKRSSQAEAATANLKNLADY